mmetsp:Transcript_35371/g.117216  ORF Transcript_35371/g.117216 Transcript_35371/m.117216 type:complete len:236 (-) Transcript_35371:495-1202(-)
MRGRRPCRATRAQPQAPYCRRRPAVGWLAVKSSWHRWRGEAQPAKRSRRGAGSRLQARACVETAGRYRPGGPRAGGRGRGASPRLAAATPAACRGGRSSARCCPARRGQRRGRCASSARRPSPCTFGAGTPAGPKPCGPSPACARRGRTRSGAAAPSATGWPSRARSARRTWQWTASSPSQPWTGISPAEGRRPSPSSRGRARKRGSTTRAGTEPAACPRTICQRCGPCWPPHRG